jgi:hypothetical protein
MNLRYGRAPVSEQSANDGRRGQAQITATRTHIRVATTGALLALVELEFIPGLK